jgi:hypothetical protein
MVFNMVPVPTSGVLQLRTSPGELLSLEQNIRQFASRMSGWVSCPERTMPSDPGARVGGSLQSWQTTPEPLVVKKLEQLEVA